MKQIDKQCNIMLSTSKRNAPKPIGLQNQNLSPRGSVKPALSQVLKSENIWYNGVFYFKKEQQLMISNTLLGYTTVVPPAQILSQSIEILYQRGAREPGRY